MTHKFKRAAVLQMPLLVPYYGPRPVWIRSGRPMLITVTDGIFRSRDGIVVTVPAGYITDLASTPRILWAFIPPHGGLLVGSLPHDWGHSHGGESGLLPKAWWDRLFRDLVIITPDVPAWKRKVAYIAVRVGGKGGWKNGWHSFAPGRGTDWKALGQESQ